MSHKQRKGKNNNIGSFTERASIDSAHFICVYSHSQRPSLPIVEVLQSFTGRILSIDSSPHRYPSLPETTKRLPTAKRLVQMPSRTFQNFSEVPGRGADLDASASASSQVFHNVFAVFSSILTMRPQLGVSVLGSAVHIKNLSSWSDDNRTPNKRDAHPSPFPNLPKPRRVTQEIDTHSSTTPPPQDPIPHPLPLTTTAGSKPSDRPTAPSPCAE
jgi:hypothetical protein